MAEEKRQAEADKGPSIDYSPRGRGGSQVSCTFLLRIGPATRCNEIDHYGAILMVLEASQTTADYRRCLPESRSSVASQLGAINCFYFLLRSAAIFIAAIAYITT